MTVTNGYCTTDQLRAELSDDTSKIPVALLEKAVNSTSRAVDKWCGRRFWQDPAVVARTYPVTDLCLAKVDDISTATGLLVATDNNIDGVFETSWTVGTDFQLEPLNADASGTAYAWSQLAAVGSLRFPLNYWNRRPLLQVTAKFGWSAVPDQVMEATVLRAVAIFKRKEAPFGIAGFGDFAAVRITRLDPDVMDMLGPFQRPMVA